MTIVQWTRFERRMERWIIGPPMAAMAWLLERAVYRSVRRG